MKKVTEDIRELRRICQFPRREYDTWHGVHICRKVSIYITRVILFLGVPADIVTVVFFLTGILACFFFILGTDYWFLIGVLTMQAWYLMDHVDGEVARYRKATTITGMYFDKVVHFVVSSGIFFSLGWGVYKDIEIVHIIALGFIAAISNVLILASEDLRDSSILQRAAIRKRNISFSGSQIIEEEQSVRKKNVIKWLFSLFHKLCTFPTVANIITLAVAVKIMNVKYILYWLIFAYAILTTFVWIVQLVFTVKNKHVDRKWMELKGNVTE